MSNSLDDLEQSVIYTDAKVITTTNNINRAIKIFNNEFFKKHGKNIIKKIDTRLELISTPELKLYCYPYIDIVFPDFWEITNSQVRLFYSFILYAVVKSENSIVSLSELLNSDGWLEDYSVQLSKCIELSQELLDKNIIVIYSFPNEKIREYLINKHIRYNS